LCFAFSFMKHFFFIIALILFVATPVLAYSPWPATDSAGTEIDAEILARNSSFEPSGAVWLASRGTFIIVSDGGQIAEIYPSGELVNYWEISGYRDLEDVTIIDEATSMIYLLEEGASSIFEFDLTIGGLTGLSWNFYGTDESRGLLNVVDGWNGVEEGIAVASLCSDDTVNSYAIFYFDADGDGLGSDTVGSFCAVIAPVGYVTNSNDTNDSIPNAGVEISGDKVDNDGDGRIDEYNTLAENGAYPYYSLQKSRDTSIFSTNILFFDSQN